MTIRRSSASYLGSDISMVSASRPFIACPKVCNACKLQSVDSISKWNESSASRTEFASATYMFPELADFDTGLGDCLGVKLRGLLALIETLLSNIQVAGHGTYRYPHARFLFYL